MAKNIVLTGIKPTGDPHLGNYLGAIAPAVELSQSPDRDSYFFIADYHALTSIHSAKDFAHYSYQVAATWLASGLDPEKCVFYRQSDVPEIFELSWILSCFTQKGLMNRAHAYKARVAENEQKKEDPDHGIDMGLYCYPVLMAADILAFDTDIVPVGADQVQHVEMTRDIANRFNHRFGQVLKLPEYQLKEDVGVIEGLDGRKMSKSYQNTIPVFCPQKRLKKLINKIKTDSTPPEEPKSTEGSTLYNLYKIFATAEQTENYARQFQEGISWGEAKAQLFEVVNARLAEPREKYDEMMANPEVIDVVLKEGARRAREKAQVVLARVHKAIGKGGV
jgi:tryptophanyl-tRNA synthetase